MEKLIQAFSNHYGSEPTILAKAPGRINLIGEHTDYNNGYVLPAAIDRYMNFAFRQNDQNWFRIKSLDLDEEVQISFDNLKKSDKSWVNFFIGILIQLKKRGYKIKGFDLLFGGNIPIGGGLSSSSALECGFLKLVNEMYNLGQSDKELIQISKSSNHEFLGLKGGIMDQHAIMHGLANHAMLLNCETNSSEHISINTEGYDFVLIDSKVSHELVNSSYNDRVQECNEALEIIKNKYVGIPHLSNVTKDQLSGVKKSMPLHIYNRARFILEENLRVHQFCKFLNSGQIIKAGQLLYDSHEGLRLDYEVSCNEMDLLVDLALKSKHVIGSRMIGGGFGGCTLNLIKSDQIKVSTEKITKSYSTITGITPQVYHIKIVGGVEVTIPED